MADPSVQRKLAELTERLGEDGRILLRKSGTEPVIRIMVEAETNELCAAYAEELVARICERGHADGTQRL